MKRITSLWHNQCGSEIRIDVAPDGRITGKMSSPVGMARPGEEFDLVGWMLGDTIAFVVHFGAHRCVTAWVGHRVVEDGDETLQTLWHMSVEVPRREWGWRATFSGADTFHRGAAPAGIRPRRNGPLPPRWSEQEEAWTD
jgi:hypothetical protein